MRASAIHAVIGDRDGDDVFALARKDGDALCLPVMDRTGQSFLNDPVELDLRALPKTRIRPAVAHGAHDAKLAIRGSGDLVQPGKKPAGFHLHRIQRYGNLPGGRDGCDEAGGQIGGNFGMRALCVLQLTRKGASQQRQTGYLLAEVLMQPAARFAMLRLACLQKPRECGLSSLSARRRHDYSQSARACL